MSNVFYKRAFLNAERGVAMVEASITDNSHGDNNGKRHVSVDGTLQITDCSRSVSLDTYVSSIEDARAAISKLDRLSDAVQGMRDAIARLARREWPGRKL